MKKLLLIFLFLGMTTFVNAQDTIIETADYYLQIHKYSADTSFVIDTNENYKGFKYHWNGHILTSILDKWMEILELEEIEYQIDKSVVNRADYTKIINKEDGSILKILSPYDSEIRDYRKDTTVSIITYYVGYNMLYQQKDAYENKKSKAVTIEALKAFCDVAGLEIEVVKKNVTYWTLELVDTVNASFSYDQNAFWKRTDLEEYIYYERIGYGRIVDLLSRKLDSFVKPISTNTKKFDIRMPRSDDAFELKYAMIEHGFELVEVAEEVDFLIIRKRE